MKRLFSIAAALAAWCAFAAVVPQKSQDDYLFSLPNATNSLTRTNLFGVVIGEPPAYSVLRREDIAWLREAACERAALAAGTWWTTNSRGRVEKPVFGHFPLAQSNRFTRYTAAREWRGGHLETNIVVGWHWVTNAFGVLYPNLGQQAGKDVPNPGAHGVDVFGGLEFGSGETRYLASSNGLLQGSQYIKDRRPPYHTNVVTTVVTNWGGIGWDGDGAIVFHSTDRVEVVTMRMTNGVESVHTNRWSESLPWTVERVSTNVTTWSYHDLLFEGLEARWDDAPPPSAMKPFPVYSYMTNSYAFLRRKRWLVDMTSNTNLLDREVFIYGGYDDNRYLATNLTEKSSAVGVESVAVLYHGGGFRTFEKSGNGRLVFPTRFAWDVVHTGAVCRIKEATLYALVGVDASWQAGSSLTNVWGSYLQKVGTATKVGSPQGGMVCYEATLDGPALANAGAAAIGAPVRGTWEEWGDDTANYYVSFFIVYEMQPWASLPGWNE